MWSKRFWFAPSLERSAETVSIAFWIVVIAFEALTAFDTSNPDSTPVESVPSLTSVVLFLKKKKKNHYPFFFKENENNCPILF